MGTAAISNNHVLFIWGSTKRIGTINSNIVDIYNKYLSRVNSSSKTCIHDNAPSVYINNYAIMTGEYPDANITVYQYYTE